MWLALGVMMAAAAPLNDLSWSVVNDTVMGGVSRGRVQGETFRGELSLESNGGFVSIRARLPRQALADAKAVKIALRGDPRTWDVTLRRSDVPLRAGSYRVKVPVAPDGIEVVLPLADFRPTSFGRAVSGAPALDSELDRIVELGFLLADKNPGPFELEVVSVTVVDGAEAVGPSRAGLAPMLMAAIDQGVPAFNAGDTERCRTVYADALEQALSSDGLTAGERSLIDEALGLAAKDSAVTASWRLRYAIDSVLASL